jgi:signal transduction histidine kinase
VIRIRRTDVILRDLPIGLLIAVMSLVPAVNSHGTRLGDVPDRPMDALAVVVVLLESLPLAVRRRWPLVCLTLVSIGFASDQLRGYHTVATIALPIALLNAGLYTGRHRRAVMVTASLAFIVLAVVVGEGAAGVVALYAILAIAWGAGSWLRISRVAEAERRRHVAESTRVAERTRIARELHDVVTHHVTAMIVQAEAARYLTAAPEKLDQTLTAITDTGRRAVTDLRHLLDLLNPDHGVEPRTVGELHALVEQTRQAGQPVEFAEDGDPAEAAGSAEATAYRVVREALTNALKYAHGRRTTVGVHHGAGEINVEISTEGSELRAVPVGGSGRGLAGLRERVVVLGGEFSAGPGHNGFVVTARIPRS